LIKPLSLRRARRRPTVDADRLSKPSGGQTKPSMPLRERSSSGRPTIRPAIPCAAAPEPPKGDYQEAIADYDKAIALDPKSWQAYSGRGITKAGLGQDDQALIDFDRAIGLDPGIISETTVDLGRQPLTQKGTPQWSNQTMRVATSSAYYIAETYLARGKLWFKRERYTEALRDLNEAIEKRSRYAEALVYRGLIKLALGQCTAGLNDLKYGSKASSVTLDSLLMAHESFIRQSECPEVM